MCCFNTQPPEGGWVIYWGYHATTEVSTHSRPKAAVFLMRDFFKNLWFQHTAARRRLLYRLFPEIKPILFQHTAARRRLPLRTSAAQGCWGFQHTAARRRLTVLACLFPTCTVSTHSRPKAAVRGLPFSARILRFQHTAARRRLIGSVNSVSSSIRFQHTAARRRLDWKKMNG